MPGRTVTETVRGSRGRGTPRSTAAVEAVATARARMRAHARVPHDGGPLRSPGFRTESGGAVVDASCQAARANAVCGGPRLVTVC